MSNFWSTQIYEEFKQFFLKYFCALNSPPLSHKIQSKLSIYGEHLASNKAARGEGKESLQRSLINFHFCFAQTKQNTIGLKVTYSQ